MAVGCVMAGLLAVGVSPAGAQIGIQAPPPPAERAGDLGFTTSSGGPVKDAGSADVVDIDLPTGAACQGDSYYGDYRVQGFIVPASDDPAQLHFTEIKPQGDGRWGLYDDATNSYTQLPTSISGPGEPGPLTDLPRMSFGVFPPGTLVDGTYKVGIACSLYNQPTRYWDTEVVVRSDADDQPGRFRWSVVGASVSSPSSPSSWPRAALLVGLAVVVLVVLAVVLSRRSKGRSPERPSAQESMT